VLVEARRKQRENVQNARPSAKQLCNVVRPIKLLLLLLPIRVSIILSLALGAVETLGPSVSEAMLRTVPQVTNRLIIATARIAGNSAKMMQAARLLAVMKFLTASQKVQVILEFFKSIGFSIKNAQVIEEAEYYLMYSEDSRFAFRVMKATGDIIFGVINTKTFDYTWTSLTE
jgi:hypothetical protein